MNDEDQAAKMYTALFYKKLIVVLVIVFGAVTTAAVLGTYFAKRPKSEENIKILDYICQNLTYIQGNKSTINFTNP